MYIYDYRRVYNDASSNDSSHQIKSIKRYKLIQTFYIDQIFNFVVMT